MDEDQLNTMLEASAPETSRIDASAVRAMMSDAEAMARPSRARHRVKIGAAAAAALALVVGGGGVAIASGLVSWPSNLENPDGSYAFTLPSGRACEVRLIVTDDASDDDQSEDVELQREIQDDVANWLRSGALDRELDLPAAEEEAVRVLSEQAEDYGMTVLIGGDGELTDHKSVEGRPTVDDVRAFAVNRAIHGALTDHLRDAGYAENTWTFSTDGGVKCAAE